MSRRYSSVAACPRCGLNVGYNAKEDRYKAHGSKAYNAGLTDSDCARGIADDWFGIAVSADDEGQPMA